MIFSFAGSIDKEFILLSSIQLADRKTTKNNVLERKIFVLYIHQYSSVSISTFIVTCIPHDNIKVDANVFMLIIKITISSIVIGFKNSYFPLIHLPSCYRTVCYWTVCYWTVCYRTVQ